MGATPWHIFIPYQPDIEKAFRELQQSVFETGNFRPVYGDIGFLDEIEFFESPDDVDEKYFPDRTRRFLVQKLNQLGSEELKKYLENLNRTNKFQSIDEFFTILSMSTDGSASILDFQEISLVPGIGTLCSLTEDQLIHYFGTTTPTRQMVETNDELWDDIPRGEAIFVVVFKKEIPVELYFAGYSAD